MFVVAAPLLTCLPADQRSLRGIYGRCSGKWARERDQMFPRKTFDPIRVEFIDRVFGSRVATCVWNGGRLVGKLWM